MCCDQTKAGETKIKKFFGTKTKATFYKALDIYTYNRDAGATIEGPIFSDYIWGPGYNVAKHRDGKLLKKGDKYSVLSPIGIHVFFTKDDALASFPLKIIVPVVCEKEEFMAADIGQAVFRRVFLSKKTWNENFKIL